MPETHYVDTVAESRRDELSRLDVLLKRLEAENARLRGELDKTRTLLARHRAGGQG